MTRNLEIHLWLDREGRTWARITLPDGRSVSVRISNTIRAMDAFLDAIWQADVEPEKLERDVNCAIADVCGCPEEEG